MGNDIKYESCQRCRSIGDWTVEQKINENNGTTYQVHCNKCYTKTSIYIPNNCIMYFGTFW